MPGTASALLLAHGFIMERNMAGSFPGHRLNFHLNAKPNSSSGGHRWGSTKDGCLEATWHSHVCREDYVLDTLDE